MSTPRLRVFVVDDHDVVRLGLWTAIGKSHTVVGHAGCGGEALEQIRRTQPDVVVVDFRLPDMPGDELCRRVREVLPSASVIVLSAYLSEETVRLALDAGAAAYVTKAAGLPELMGVLKRLEDGIGWVASETAPEIVSRLHAVVSDRTDAVPLTPHQESILELAAQGLTNNQISSRLYISESTVRFHLQNLKKKLGARSKTDLVVRAIRLGAIAPAPESVGTA